MPAGERAGIRVPTLGLWSDQDATEHAPPVSLAHDVGLAFTRRLAQEGAKVYFTDVNATAGKENEQALRAAGLRVGLHTALRLSR